MQENETRSDNHENANVKTWLGGTISIRASMATGITAILGILHARSTTGAGNLNVDYILVPVAQVLLFIACMIVLQAPRTLPRWWLRAICFAGTAMGIEIARFASTALVLGGLAMQGILLSISLLLAWLVAREKLKLESIQNAAKGILIFGGLLYGGFATTWAPPASIYLLFAMLMASWSVRASLQQMLPLQAASRVVKNPLSRLIMLSLAITAALIFCSMLAMSSVLPFLYPAIAGWTIILLEIIALVQPMPVRFPPNKIMDILIAVEFLAILLGSA